VRATAAKAARSSSVPRRIPEFDSQTLADDSG
jgi:hypothetical protein